MNRKNQFALLAIVAVAAVVLLLKSWFDEAKLQAVNSSFEELYNDRLIAEQQIHEMSEIVHRKKWALAERAMDQKPISFGEESQLLESTFSEFMTTKLAETEKPVSRELSSTMIQVRELENNWQTSGELSADLLAGYDRMLGQLEKLSDIQITEGRKLKADGQERIVSSVSGLQFQASICIVLLVVLVSLVKTLDVEPKIYQQHELN